MEWPCERCRGPPSPVLSWSGLLRPDEEGARAAISCSHLLLSAAMPLIRPRPPGPRQAPMVTWTGRCYAPNRFTTRRRSEVYCFRLLFEKRRQRHQYSIATMSAAAAAAPERSQKQEQEQSFARRLPKIEVSCTRPTSLLQAGQRATVRSTNRARLSCTHT